MERTIKFRAWDKNIGRMLDSNQFSLTGFGKTFKTNTDGEQVKLPNLELMQFTGLLDKNGKEIYEGDVVRVWEEQDEERIFSEVCEVKWFDFTTGWYFSGVNRNVGDIERKNLQAEIIGNIHQNPELISS